MLVVLLVTPILLVAFYIRGRSPFPDGVIWAPRTLESDVVRHLIFLKEAKHKNKLRKHGKNLIVVFALGFYLVADLIRNILALALITISNALLHRKLTDSFLIDEWKSFQKFLLSHKNDG